MQLSNVVIVDGVRTAFARGGRGKLVATRLDEAGAKVDPRAARPQPEGHGPHDRRHRPRQRRRRAANSRHRRDTSRASPACRSKCARSTATASAARAWRRCTASPSRSWSARPNAASRSASSAWAARWAAAAAARADRITEFNKRRLEMNDAQRNMAPDHYEHFSVPFPDDILDCAAAAFDDPDGAERRRGLRPLARRDGRVRGARATEDRARPTRRASTRTRSSRSKSKSRSSTPGQLARRRARQDDHLRPRRVHSPRHEHRGARQPEAGQGHQSYGGKELRITAGNSLPDERRHLRRAADERGEGAASSASSRWRASSASASPA